MHEQFHQRHYPQGGQQNQGFNLPNPNDIRRWITDRLDQNAIDFADRFGKYLVNMKFRTNQIRRIFGEIRSIKLSEYTENDDAVLIMLKPKLAYTVGRQTGQAKEAAENLKKFIVTCIDNILNERDLEKKSKYFDNFANLFEAVLSYHKYHGGQD